MKKVVFTGILFATVIVAFLVGMAVGKNGHNQGVVGVYETNSWNGKVGTLVLYEDGICQYPSGESATWKLDGETVRITFESISLEQNRGTKEISIIISNELSQEKTDGVLNAIERINNIEGVYWNGETRLCQITLRQAESENITGKTLGEIEGVSIVEYVYEKEEKGSEITEYEAKVMEKGLVLHEIFFKKVSN